MDFGVFTLLQTPSQLDDLAAVAQHIRSVSENRRNHAAGWRRLIPVLSRLVLSQNPAASHGVEILAGIFGKLADTEGVLAESESRAAEDLRDIVERYSVIFRCNETYSEASNILDYASLELSAALADDRENSNKSNYPATKFKYKAAIEKAKDDKRQAIAQLKDAIARSIEMHERYATFRVRRMTHAWQTLGAAVAAWVSAETPLFVQLRSALREWRKGAVVGEEVIATVEAAVGDKVAEHDRTLVPADEPPPTGDE
jgi:hypothetical protein